MALVGGIPGILYEIVTGKNRILKDNSWIRTGVLAGTAWLSVVLASVSCSLLLGLSGTITLGKVFPAMVGVHNLIGLGEALITAAAAAVLISAPVKKSGRLSIIIPSAAAVLTGLILSPFASGFPDGLEKIAEKFRFLHESAPLFVSPMPDYTLPLMGDTPFSTGAAGFLGVLITFLSVAVLGFLFNLKKNTKTVSE
jgi:cobalt/nickel transport system permease protein